MDFKLNAIAGSSGPMDNKSRPTLESLHGFDWVDSIMPVTRRQLPVILFATATVVGLAALYLALATPKFTASTEILIDGRHNQDQLSASIADLTFDTGAIDSQVEVIKSDNVTAEVLKSLSLDRDPEFAVDHSIVATLEKTAKSLLHIGNFFHGEDAAQIGEDATRQLAIANLQKDLDVRRIAHTYVLSIDFTSTDPTKAAKISQAFADAYFADQLNAKLEETKKASGWLQERIAELKQQSLSSDMAVQQFMAQNGLIADADGKFLADQQLTEITTEMSAAHADTAKAEARLKQINDAIEAGRIDTSVTDALDNPVISDLRSKYLTASKSEAELAQKLGETHYQVESLKRDMQQYEALIFAELKRIAETYSSDLQVAVSKEKSLNESMSTLINQKAISNQTMVQLRELQRESDTYRNLYQTFLQKYQDAIQQQSFPNSEARTISPAAVPDRPSHPKKLLILAGAFLFAAMAGLGLAFLRERSDRTYRTGTQLRDATGLNLVGITEILPYSRLGSRKGKNDALSMQVSDGRLRYTVDNPLSSYAESLRSVKVAADLTIRKTGSRVIGIVSAMPGDGKTTTAKNLSTLLADQGSKVMLLDCDLRDAGLTRQLAAHAKVGLLELLSGQANLKDCVVMEVESGLSFLPAVIKRPRSANSQMLTSAQFQNLLNVIGDAFDYIVVDLPPLAPVVDVRAIGALLDGFLFVVAWGKTPRAIVESVLFDDPVLRERCFGAILNRTNRKRMRLYANEDLKGYYYGQYKDYYALGQERA